MTLATSLGATDFPYATRRAPLLVRNGVVASSSPIAAQAGLRMLLKGGNAVDAALATAITLTVVEPWVNGIGSDLFSIIWDGSKLHGLNGSGRAPATHTPELFAKQGLTEMPAHGWLPVTVSGAPRAWADMHAKFGKLSFEELFEPAVDYAESGFALAPESGAVWGQTQVNWSQTLSGPEYAGWFSTFAPNERAARAGDVWQLPDHGKTLRRIAETKAEAFYSGDLAEKIAAFAAETGGYLTVDDLAAHTSSWVEPISMNYRGFDVWEMPPNGQGIAALQTLGMLEGFDMAATPRETIEAYHLQIEAMKLGFADTRRYVGDPDQVQVPVKGMLDKEYLASRRALITDTAQVPTPGEPPKGGTVYLCAADGNGMMVSLIQSNYQGFGSGVVVPGTGISLHNRGRGFNLTPGHPNEVAPHKRPFHTIIPAFLTEGGRAIGPFGVMGAEMQPQGHTQMVLNQVDYGMNPQQSLDAPRWRWLRGKEVVLEDTVPAEVVQGLIDKGHEVKVSDTFFNAGFGRGQIIRRLENGAYMAGSEPRADGCAVGY